MGFNKVTSAKGGRANRGRPKKKTQQWNELESLMTGGKILERVTKYLNGLNDKELFEAFMQLLEYFKPKKARQEIVGDSNNPIQINVNGVDIAKYPKPNNE